MVRHSLPAPRTSSKTSVRPASRPWLFLLWVFLLLTLTLLLTGCGKGDAPPDIIPIVKAVLATAALSAAKARAGVAAKHFVERRVFYLVGKNASWAKESGYTSLVARIGSEMNQVATFVDDRIAAL